jgi:hypothetical protein
MRSLNLKKLMRKNLPLLFALLVGAALCLTSGCVVYPVAPAPVVGEVDVAGAPPPLIVEAAPPSPGVDFVWIGGSWVWNGRWVWEHGRWDRPPHPGAVWVAHRYEYRNGRHVFVRGGWR